MNWDRLGNFTPAEWAPRYKQEGRPGAYSTIRHTSLEVFSSAPFAIQCRDMIEANQQSLKFFRVACRLLPAIINRQGNQVHLDYHQSKLNLAKWIRKGANIRDPMEVTRALVPAYDFLYDCAYCEFESGVYNRFLVNSPDKV